MPASIQGFSVPPFAGERALVTSILATSPKASVTPVTRQGTIVSQDTATTATVTIGGDSSTPIPGVRFKAPYLPRTGDIVDVKMLRGDIWIDGSNGGTTAFSFGGSTYVGAPTTPSTVTNKSYVDNTFVDRSTNQTAGGGNGIGGDKSFLNNIYVNTPTTTSMATNKGYVDGNFVDQNSNQFSINGQKTFLDPVFVSTPTTPSMVSNKSYVDNNFVDRNSNQTAGNGNGIAGDKSFLDNVYVNTPSTTSMAANKGYVDSSTANQVDTNSTQTITGQKSFNGPTFVSAPTTPSMVANKSYVDGAFGNYYTKAQSDNGYVSSLNNDTVAGTIGFNGSVSFNNTCFVGTPTSASQATNKSYVDGAISAANSNQVTTNTTQTITGQKSFNGPVFVPTPTSPSHPITLSYANANYVHL